MVSRAHWHLEVACLEHPFCTEVITCAKQMTECFFEENWVGLSYRFLLCLGFQVAFMINVCSQPRRPAISWAASEAAWPAGQGRGFCPSAPLWWEPTWGPVSSSGVLNTGQTRSCWSRSRGGHKKDKRDGTPLLQGKAERVGAVQPGEEKVPERPYSILSVLKGGLWERWGQTL